MSHPGVVRTWRSYPTIHHYRATRRPRDPALSIRSLPGSGHPPRPRRSPSRLDGGRPSCRALYVEACGEWRLQHFDTAIGLFDDLLTLDPRYSGAADLRNTAQRGRWLADTYSSANAAEDIGDWLTAARSYDEILQADPAYRDAATRKKAREARERVANLQAELHHHADTGHWQAVLDVDAELTRLDPSSSDPGGLATRAPATLAAEQRAVDLERIYAQARRRGQRCLGRGNPRLRRDPRNRPDIPGCGGTP